MDEPRVLPEYGAYAEEYGLPPEDLATGLDNWIIKRYGQWEVTGDPAEQ